MFNILASILSSYQLMWKCLSFVDLSNESKQLGSAKSCYLYTSVSSHLICMYVSLLVVLDIIHHCLHSVRSDRAYQLLYMLLDRIVT